VKKVSLFLPRPPSTGRGTALDSRLSSRRSGFAIGRGRRVTCAGGSPRSFSARTLGNVVRVLLPHMGFPAGTEGGEKALWNGSHL